MLPKTIHFNDKENSSYQLEEDSNLFVMRVIKGLNPSSILEQVKGIQSYLSLINPVADFPDSRVYVYRCECESNSLRDEIKRKIKKERPQDVEYVGSVLKYSRSGYYQIYTNNVFIKFRDQLSTSDANAFLKKHKLRVKRLLHFANQVYFVEHTQNLGQDIFSFCEELLQYDYIECCHPELVTRLRATQRTLDLENLPNDHLDIEWWLKRAGLTQAWQFSKGKSSTIAIIDDGIDQNHPAFQNKFVSPRDMMDASGISFPVHQHNEMHGTACASIACSCDPQAWGAAPEAKLIPIRVTGLGSVLQAEAIYWAVQQGADVISCSWGPPDGDFSDDQDKAIVYPLPDHTRLAFEYAVRSGRRGKGTPIVFAAGNGKEPVKYDGYASSEYVFAVSAINHHDKNTIYSDYGPPILCCFPSGDYEVDQNGQYTKYSGIQVADRIGHQGFSKDDYYALFSGTSASCPGVAGVIALLYDVNPNLTVHQVKEIIKQSSEEIKQGNHDANGYSNAFGYGLLRADWAVRHAKTKLTNTMDQTKKSAISLHIGINYVDRDFYNGHINELYACVRDMERMGSLAQRLGYDTHFLENEQATRDTIKEQIVSLGNSVEERGILLITYAGHGVQLRDKDASKNGKDTENDGKDESWVTYDGFLLDDEIYNILSKIEPTIRVVLVSDSCHSQTMTRNIAESNFAEGKNYRERGITQRTAQKILEENNLTPQKLRAMYAPHQDSSYKVYVKNLSACLAEETAKEKDEGGFFTTVLNEEYSKLVKNGSNNYDVLINRIKHRLVGDQQPNWSNSHNRSIEFDNQFPFDTNKIPLTGFTSNGSFSIDNHENIQDKDSVKNNLDDYPLYIRTDQLLVNNIKGAPTLSRTVSNRSFSGYTAWDKAYQYILQNQDETDYVEPEILSQLYLTDTEFTEERGTENYLSTYPYPEEYNHPNPFIWHLDDEHSQLKSANEEVFPQIKLGVKNIITDNLVKIAHIDTGYLPGHPTLPVNFQNAISFDLGNDEGIDNDALFALAEQQGHGNATLALLAGNWIDLEDTNNNYHGFFGAIPYAKVLPIKISETVALLSGRNFANAVDYAIDQECDVITMSMAGLPSRVMAKAVNRAYEAGIVIVSAASNSFSKGMGRLLPKRTLYPARYDRVIAAVGATYNHKPYLNEFHGERERAAGGLYMQTCYGPASVLPTSLAAYTPNIIWFKGEKPGNYYVKTGGGTSSATPQISAAAALYIQKYKEELGKFKGKKAWVKAEIVRQALFQSAEDAVNYQHIYGNGILKAHNALNEAYTPDKLENQVSKAKKAPEKRRFFGGLFGLWRDRGLQTPDSKQVEERLSEMMFTEIQQLLHVDPQLFPYLDNISLDAEDDEFKLDDPALINKLIESEHASDFLKQHLTVNYRKVTSNISADNPEFNSVKVEGEHSNMILRSRGAEFIISNKKSCKEYYDNHAVWVDEFEMEIKTSRSLRSGAVRELTIELDNEEMSHVMLLEKDHDEGTFYEWRSPLIENISTNERRARGSSDHKGVSYYRFGAEEINARDRGLFKKLIVKLYKWFKPKDLEAQALKKLAKPLGDHRYDIMVCDLKADPGTNPTLWKNIEEYDEDIYQAIEKEKSKAVLVCLPGLFSKVEKGFDEFLEVQENRHELLKKHCRYVLGLNMPTVFHGIEDNAKEFQKMFKGKFKSPKQCNILARSRGGLVARYLFEKIWTNNNQPVDGAPFNLNRLVMFGTPNQGTMMASTENWRSMFNFATNVARLSIGTIVPIVPTILTVMKAVGTGITELPGINDLEEKSDIIKKLNKEVDSSKYFVFTSDFEPNRKFFKRIFDEFLVDRTIFKREKNDSITPVLGAIFASNGSLNGISLPESQYHISNGKTEVSHFSYLHSKHPEIIEKLFKVV